MSVADVEGRTTHGPARLTVRMVRSAELEDEAEEDRRQVTREEVEELERGEERRASRRLEYGRPRRRYPSGGAAGGAAECSSSADSDSESEAETPPGALALASAKAAKHRQAAAPRVLYTIMGKQPARELKLARPARELRLRQSAAEVTAADDLPRAAQAHDGGPLGGGGSDGGGGKARKRRGAQPSQSARRRQRREDAAVRREEGPTEFRGGDAARRLLARLRAAIAARDVARALLKGSGDRPNERRMLRSISTAYDVAWGHSWRSFDRPRFPPESLEGHVHNAEVRLEAEKQRMRRECGGGEGGGSGEGLGSG
jgi:hypothetical protein